MVPRLDIEEHARRLHSLSAAIVMWIQSNGLPADPDELTQFTGVIEEAGAHAQRLLGLCGAGAEAAERVRNLGRLAHAKRGCALVA